MQMTNSFEARGAINKLMSMDPVPPSVVPPPLVTTVRRCLYAHLLGIHHHVVPNNTPKSTASNWAVELTLALRHVRPPSSARSTAIPSSTPDDYDIIEYGHRWARGAPGLLSLDYLLVPIGGGGLIGGISSVKRALSPERS